VNTQQCALLVSIPLQGSTPSNWLPRKRYLSHGRRPCPKHRCSHRYRPTLTRLHMQAKQQILTECKQKLFYFSLTISCGQVMIYWEFELLNYIDTETHQYFTLVQPS
jgi:hypothetical protein